ncbi:MAG: hypothetical protein LBT97_01805 [Planctomycetota bacterium]|jgi:hypothetical protein|nr:hypothetical protein [Planctomycetota bacterium]
MILKSERAVAASVQIIRAFVHLRHALNINRSLAWKVEELAAKVGDHGKAIAIIFQELDLLALESGPEHQRERIGFKPNNKREISGKGKPPEED